jgi:C4-dicarboxylate-specific signal transduction histidine kinase
MELIWSYWQEEGMLVQTMNAVTRRFQNMRSPLGNDPLANMEIDPLRSLNNLLWGMIQDEQHRLSVVRRNYEYDHHYGLRLAGKPLQAEEWAQYDRHADHQVVSRLEAARVTVALPLFAQGELAGVLLLGEKVSGGQFHPGEIELLEMLMGQTGIALENARLYSDLRDQMRQLTQTQQQLIQAAKLAAVGELAAGVAHEINNPLMIILGNCELALRDVPETGRAAKRLAIIESEATRAGKITRDLLNFARRREPRREPVAVEAVIERAVELLGTKLARGRVRVHTVLHPGMPPILGDADQLTQVLLNLGANAFLQKPFMPDELISVLKYS